MRKIVFLRFGGRDPSLRRLVGAFILAFAVLMFLHAAAQMFDSWDALKHYPDCVANLGSESEQIAMMKYTDCKDSLYKITGMQLKGDQGKITKRQYATALLLPIANLFFWAIVFILGTLFYSRDSTIGPIDVISKEIQPPGPKRKAKK